MAKRSLSRLLLAAASKKKKAADRELVLKWRALRKVGAYDTKELPATKRLTKSRRAEITRKFRDVQNLGTYQEGEVYRPFHREVRKTSIFKIDEMGRQRYVGQRKSERYVIDPDHFQVFKKHKVAAPGDALKTSKGFIAPKLPNEKLRVTKSGKVETTEVKGGALTKFTREPLSGPTEFLRLLNDILAGRMKFKKNEGLALWNNGFREAHYGQSAVEQLARRMQRYAAGDIWRGRGGRGSFDDWANSSEIAFIRRK